MRSAALPSAVGGSLGESGSCPGGRIGLTFGDVPVRRCKKSRSRRSNRIVKGGAP